MMQGSNTGRKTHRYGIDLSIYTFIYVYVPVFFLFSLYEPHSQGLGRLEAVTEYTSLSCHTAGLNADHVVHTRHPRLSDLYRYTLYALNIHSFLPVEAPTHNCCRNIFNYRIEMMNVL